MEAPLRFTCAAPLTLRSSCSQSCLEFLKRLPIGAELSKLRRVCIRNHDSDRSKNECVCERSDRPLSIACKARVVTCRGNRNQDRGAKKSKHDRRNTRPHVRQYTLRLAVDHIVKRLEQYRRRHGARFILFVANVSKALQQREAYSRQSG